ncbi:MAG: hypothetical protein A2161_06350 [Candidatus Schekmanbacteria bacterium RBG_13_48_7]|uniref:Uncharacterized protein n=1 Tax=Candidatus Schekmanbacteria bacterium RBG_13_48_7 TaxID=1817878 RepID=A0A1F7S2T7_9BACT|nr:MAG: hypothetical protein A2161_06350 [Candidatus Schekmanbacteria bacterium RBG_13_48_7]
MKIIQLTSSQGQTLKNVIDEALPNLSKVQKERNILFKLKPNQQQPAKSSSEKSAYQVTISESQDKKNQNTTYDRSGKIISC